MHISIKEKSKDLFRLYACGIAIIGTSALNLNMCFYYSGCSNRLRGRWDWLPTMHDRNRTCGTPFRSCSTLLSYVLYEHSRLGIVRTPLQSKIPYSVLFRHFPIYSSCIVGRVRKTGLLVAPLFICDPIILCLQVMKFSCEQKPLGYGSMLTG